MPVARLLTTILAALGSVAVIPDGVHANGGAFFNFDRRYYVPGEVVTTQTSFSNEVEKSGRIEDGPYFAYLLSSDRWIHPPEIPGDAIPIGPITITNPSGSVPTARITFTVPEIDPGPYTLTICNQPCSHATLGDLVGGSFAIAPTKEEALRRELSDRFDGRLAQVRGNLAARIRSAEKAQRDLTPRTEVQRLADRVTRLEARLARMQNERPTQEPVTQTAPWIAVSLILSLAGLLWVRRRHRRPRATTPARRPERSDQTIPGVSSDPEELPTFDDRPGRELDPAKL